MKIEEGKFYTTRDGRKVGPMKRVPSVWELGEEWVLTDTNDGETAWRRDGSFHPIEGLKDATDLITEWTDEPRPWGELTDAEKGALLLAENEGKCVQFLNKMGNWQNLSSIKFTDYMERIWFNSRYTYRVKPEPVVETVTLQGFINELGGEFSSTIADDLREITITLTTKDGEPATGTFTNEYGDIIRMDLIDV